jgi:hypothetical protein
MAKQEAGMSSSRWNSVVIHLVPPSKREVSYLC